MFVGMFVGMSALSGEWYAPGTESHPASRLLLIFPNGAEQSRLGGRGLFVRVDLDLVSFSLLVSST